MTRYNSAESATLQPTPASFDPVHPERSEAKSKEAQDRLRQAQDHPSREGRGKGTHPGLRPPLRGGEEKISPPRRGAALAAGWVLPRFLRCRRAAGTALTAALFTLMSLAGIAFASDHVWLVYQRDLLKAATDAASIATTKALHALPSSLTNKQVKNKLRPTAKRYILANIPEGYRDQVKKTWEVFIRPNRKAGTVRVFATADLGGAIFGTWLWGTVVSKTKAKSKTERIESITEVALAIDITGSMNTHLGGGKTRMQAVKTAALTLVDVLTNGGGKSVAIGLVPWHDLVTLDQATRTRWEDKAWATPPTRQYYPNPGNRKAGEWQTVTPSKPEAWKGCVEQRSTSDSNPPPPDLSTVHPKNAPFTMGFYSADLHSTGNALVAYECDPSTNLSCYAGCAQDRNKCGTTEQMPVSYCFGGSCLEYMIPVRHIWPQKSCEPHTDSKSLSPLPPIQPLTTDVATVKRSITNLEQVGHNTYSALGVLWGHRLLAPTWRDAWGDPVHPVDPSQHQGAQKALVVLTDGQDLYYRYAKATLEEHRQTACKAAKDAGIKVFVIGVGDLPRAQLTQCSSQDRDPSGEYLFLYQNATAENLQAAFESIGRQLVRFRRVS